MGEEVKKSRPAPDPNSAKFKLGQIAAKAYSDAMEAKARGRDGRLVRQQLPGGDSGNIRIVCMLSGKPGGRNCSQRRR